MAVLLITTIIDYTEVAATIIKSFSVLVVDVRRISTLQSEYEPVHWNHTSFSCFWIGFSVASGIEGFGILAPLSKPLVSVHSFVVLVVNECHLPLSEFDFARHLELKNTINPRIRVGEIANDKRNNYNTTSCPQIEVGT